MCFYGNCNLPILGSFTSRRGFLRMASAGALTVAMPHPSFAADETILSSHGSGFCNLAFFLTHALQLAKQEGVKLDMVMTPNFADQVTILGAGQADAGLIPYTNFLALAGDGVPLKIVAGGGIEGCVLVAQPGLDSPEKLKGKTLGTLQLNTLETLPYDWLKRKGVSFKDINVRYMGSTPEGVEAFRAGALDMICTIEPYASGLLRDVKGSVMLSDGVDIYGKGYTDCVLAVRTDVINSHRPALKALIKGMMRAQLKAETDPDEVLKQLVGTYYKTSLENAKIAMAKQPCMVDARSQSKFILERTDTLLEMGYLKRKPDASVLDWSVLEEAIVEDKDVWDKLRYKSA
jgi:NitT/TauT family transport system substrate-binding protein